MQYDQYIYKEGEVILDFKFEKGEKNVEQKRAFVTMLEKATEDLKKELTNI